MGIIIHLQLGGHHLVDLDEFDHDLNKDSENRPPFRRRIKSAAFKLAEGSVFGANYPPI